MTYEYLTPAEQRRYWSGEWLEDEPVKRDKRDAQFSLEIRERDRWTCQRCSAVHLPKSQGLHCAHMFGRGKLRTRFDPENACALCYGCHRFLDGNPDLKREFFRLRLGEEAFEALELRIESNKGIGMSEKFVAIWIAGLATLTERRWDGYALIAADRRHGFLIETGGRIHA